MADLEIHPGSFGEYADEYGFTEAYEEYAVVSYDEIVSRYYEGVAEALGITVEEVKNLPADVRDRRVAEFIQVD